MRMIVAYVQPFMAPQVMEALQQLPGVTGASSSKSEGFGRGRSVVDAPVSEELYGTTDKVRLEVVVRDELEDAVVQAIRGAAHTGNRGDGKIFVLQVTKALRIATNDEGILAV